MRILAIDLGRRRVGVAISDPEGIIASPLEQFEAGSRREMIRRVAELLEAHGAEQVVVGLPLHADGSRGEQAAWTERAAAALGEALEVPVVLWDERFTTEQAEEAMASQRVPQSERKARRDMVAASFILQSYLDAGTPGS